MTLPALFPRTTPTPDVCDVCGGIIPAGSAIYAGYIPRPDDALPVHVCIPCGEKESDGN